MSLDEESSRAREGSRQLSMTCNGQASGRWSLFSPQHIQGLELNKGWGGNHAGSGHPPWRCEDVPHPLVDGLD